MPADARPVSYSTTQMSLHWFVMLLVVVQFVFNDSIQRALQNAALTGEYAWMEGGIVTHTVIGGSIFVAMCVRLWLRLTRGVPPAPSTEAKPIRILSRATHWAFYGVLLAMPLFGAAALFLISPALGQIHAYASWALLALIALHVAGAAYHAVKSGSRAHKRMLSRGPSKVRLD